MAALALASCPSAHSASTLTIDVDKPGHTISPTLYGIFFEDINCSADGGLYAELVRNRNFEDSQQPDHWTVISSGSAQVLMQVDASQALSKSNPHALKVQVISPGGKRTGVANEGFWGIPIAQGETYNLSFFAKGAGGYKGPLTASLESADGAIQATAKLKALKPDWTEYKLSLTAGATDPKARLVISTTRAGTFWLDM
ncbi:MAG TPA: carbohydrate binding domain-containing protein, partial [Verrucomicrobiae bacterium]|nr:carbohydrate binding domain-containing protein [Verrucomicrobiae bacterium]